MAPCLAPLAQAALASATGRSHPHTRSFQAARGRRRACRELQAVHLCEQRGEQPRARAAAVPAVARLAPAAQRVDLVYEQDGRRGLARARERAAQARLALAHIRAEQRRAVQHLRRARPSLICPVLCRLAQHLRRMRPHVVRPPGRPAHPAPVRRAAGPIGATDAARPALRGALPGLNRRTERLSVVGGKWRAEPNTEAPRRLLALGTALLAQTPALLFPARRCSRSHSALCMKARDAAPPGARSSPRKRPCRGAPAAARARRWPRRARASSCSSRAARAAARRAAAPGPGARTRPRVRAATPPPGAGAP